MKKKLMALLLAGVMAVATVGCGGKQAASTDTPANDSTETVVNGEGNVEETEAPTSSEPSYDFGGRVVRIGSYYDMTPDPSQNEFSRAYAERIKFVEDNYNCKIEFVNLGEDYEKAYITSVLSGTPVCDVGYILTYRLLPSLIEGGIAYPISDLGVIDFNAPQYSKPVTEACTYEGKVYALAQTSAECRYGIFYNKTLFERYNLPDLYDLYKAGEWNWAKFKEVALAGNQDLDGDGEYDVHGFNHRLHLAWNYLASNGADAVKKTDNGVELALETPEAMEALEAYADFMQTVPHLGGWLGDWQSQIWDFRDGNSCMCLEEWWIAPEYLDEMEDSWGFVPFPIGPNGKEYVSYGKESSPLMMLNGIENPEEVAQIMDLIYQSFEDEEGWNDAIEAKFEADADDAHAVEVVMDLMNKVSISPILGFTDLDSLVNEMLQTIEWGQNTPQNAIEAYRSALDAAIEDIKTHDYAGDLQAEIAEDENAEETEEGEEASEESTEE
ncbi:MAG: extracellular solute-binding protein [Lachnospiraceae bacterium]|nr:extracellular solute-binding protein [Lachnospiraceae bacterium]